MNQIVPGVMQKKGLDQFRFRPLVHKPSESFFAPFSLNRSSARPPILVLLVNIKSLNFYYFQLIGQKCPKLKKLILHDNKPLTSREDCSEFSQDMLVIPPGSAPEFRDDYVPNPDEVGRQLSLAELEQLLHDNKGKINYFLHCDQVSAPSFLMP